MIVSNPIIDEALRKRLIAHAATKRRQHSVRALGWASAFILFWIICWAIVDRLYPLPSFVRLVLLLAGIGVVLLVAWRAVYRLFVRTIRWSAVAADVEGEQPLLAERLQTVIAQSSFPPDQRGSFEMLQRLSCGIQDELERYDQLPKPLIERRQIVPWAVFGGLLISVLFLPGVSFMDIRQLLTRQLLPLSNAPAVTTTRLQLQPFPSEVVEGTSLTIVARVDRAIGDPMIHLRREGLGTTSARMIRAADGSYSYVVSPMDRDLYFNVECGDASTPTALVSVLHVPSVEHVSVRCIFPSYLRRPPSRSEQIGGSIEAPVGTHCTVVITPSEPIQSAKMELTGGSGRIVIPILQSTSSSRWTAAFDVANNGHYSIRMRSKEGVFGNSPAYSIAALNDSPPTAMFLFSETVLRISPTGTIALPFLVSDNDGPPSVSANLRLESGSVVSVPVTMVQQDDDSVKGFVRLDMNHQDAQVDDVVGVELTAMDSAGSRSVVRKIQFLVSPVSTDVSAWRRRIDVDRLVKSSGTVATRLTTALAAFDAVASSAERLVTVVSPRISEADEAAAMSVRALLDAITYAPSPREAEVLADLADQAQLLAVGLAKFNDDIESSSPETATEMIRGSILIANDLKQAANDLQSKERAIESLAVRSSLQSVRQKRHGLANTEKLFAEVTADMDRSLAESLADMKLTAADPNLEDRLRQHIAEVGAKLQRDGRSDLPAASRRWAARTAPDATTLEARLLVASQAESARPDGSKKWARDVRLAAVAIRRIDTGALAGAPIDIRERFAEAVANILAERDALRSGSDPTGSVEIIQKAALARKMLTHWADDPSLRADIVPASSPSAATWPRDALVSPDIEEPARFALNPARSREDIRQGTPVDADLQDSLKVYFDALKRHDARDR